MSTNFVINARSREDTGKGASRRLRRQSGEVPAIIYGGKKHAEKISILHKDITKALENEAVYSSIIVKAPYNMRYCIGFSNIG